MKKEALPGSALRHILNNKQFAFRMYKKNDFKKVQQRVLFRNFFHARLHAPAPRAWRQTSTRARSVGLHGEQLRTSVNVSTAGREKTSQQLERKKHSPADRLLFSMKHYRIR